MPSQLRLIKPRDLSKLGYTNNAARSLATELVAKHFMPLNG